MPTDLYREEDMEIPNEETLQAMQEVEEMIQNPKLGKRYHDVDEMLEELIASRRANWNNIPEEEPDEIDLAMLRDIETDPECKEFLSAEESRKVLWG